MVQELAGAKATPVMPVLFLGHGTPMNAIELNTFSAGWKRITESIPTPTAILCVSAHWETSGTKVTAMQTPPTIHDFGGFPQELFDTQYPAPGSPELAAEIAQHTPDDQEAQNMKHHVELDHAWGLDHGAWSVLNQMYPLANIPTLQLSLDTTAKPLTHLEIARQLAFLRSKGVLVIGSGNIAHNLRTMRPGVDPFDWNVEFDNIVTPLIQENRVTELAEYHKLGAAAQLAIPTNEHYLPMLYAAALRTKTDDIQFFNDQLILGSMSMKSFMIF
ncbi:MAG: 4,5-DOPA dioxygenase extradiol [Ignavibacteria bacterium]|nr:4,5-DOPA dioxygenase extradiol [Ignavibacteria bacterium]